MLYGKVDTARHLAETVSEINAMEPQPDLVMITGDLVEHPGPTTYSHFSDLIAPLNVPVYLMPGNHDDPEIMWSFFRDTPMFPARPPHFQYAIEDYPFRILALNSHFDDSELPYFGERRLAWLDRALGESDQPTLIAIHHPPMRTGIGFIDMVGAQWYDGLSEVCSAIRRFEDHLRARPHRPSGPPGQHPGVHGRQHRAPVDCRPRQGRRPGFR